MSIRLGIILSLLPLGGLLSPGQALAQTPCPAGNLIIYHAGSLSPTFTALENIFTAQTGVCISDASAGSIDAARRITTGGQAADIFASADPEVIELFLKPPHYADYDIYFGKGKMALAYTTNSHNASSLSDGTPFNPPASIPKIASNWPALVTQAGAWFGGSHPFLDPSGYHSHQIFELAEKTTGIIDLYDTLLGHYSIIRTTDKLGTNYDYQVIYEFEALSAALADTTGTYRYVELPDTLNLGNPSLDKFYSEAGITVPGLDTGDAPVTIPATQVEWSLTVLNSAPNKSNAVKFLKLLFSSQGVAQQQALGPAPISPPVVSGEDYEHLPRELKSVVLIDPRLKSHW